MNISGIGQSYLGNVATTNRYNKNNVGEFYQQKQEIDDESFSERTRQNANIQDIYEALKNSRASESVKEQEDNAATEDEVEKADSQESETQTEIIVKPDGSRVLVMTMSIGGMETTMSLEISKPTEAPNENTKQDTDNDMLAAKNDTVSEMSVISNDD